MADGIGQEIAQGALEHSPIPGNRNVHTLDAHAAPFRQNPVVLGQLPGQRQQRDRFALGNHEPMVGFRQKACRLSSGRDCRTPPDWRPANPVFVGGPDAGKETSVCMRKLCSGCAIRGPGRRKNPTVV